jgi:hypothetical protein
MKEERSWMSLVLLMMKIEISSFITNTEESINNGKLFMLTNIQMNQSRENSILTLVFMLRETST